MTSQGPLTGHHPRNRRLWTAVRLVILACGCTLLAACPNPPEAPDESETPKALGGSFAEKTAETSERPERSLDATSLQNMSELLAGILPSADDPEWQEGDQPTIDPVWLEHGRAMDEIWQQIGPRRDAMAEWAANALGQLHHADAPLVYPFGGPDLLTALTFFPAAKSYILVGLEAPGRLPMPEDFSGEALADDLDLLRATFRSMAQSGYFVRTQIDRGVQESEFDGVLPVLLICLVRGGQLPLAVDYVDFDRHTQEIQPLPAEQTEASAVRILFRALGEDDSGVGTRAVYYFAQDLSNRGLLADDPFAELLRRQGALHVYMKAAEYLLHTSDFLQFRKILLAESELILQDDSGIPIRHFTSDRWQLQYFGQYSDVLAAYKPYFQEDLAAAFARKAGPLSFRIGYGAASDGGGLILATRKPDSAETMKPLGSGTLPGG